MTRETLKEFLERRNAEDRADGQPWDSYAEGCTDVRDVVLKRLGDVDAVKAEMTGILHVLAGDTGPASSDWTPEASLMRLAALIDRIEAVAPEAE